MSPTSYQLLHPASLVGGIGFEPMKAKPADLQSAPFNHSGIRPHGAGNRTRTYDLLITNQLLYQLSYASTSVTRVIIHTRKTLTFEDGKEIATDDLKLYYK